MLVETLWQDLCYGARMLSKKPGFSAIAVLTLALGIGANTAIFSVVNAVLLKPLPFAEPDALLAVGQNNSQNRARLSQFSFRNFADFRDRSQSFERLAAYYNTNFTLTGGARSGAPARHGYHGGPVPTPSRIAGVGTLVPA